MVIHSSRKNQQYIYCHKQRHEYVKNIKTEGSDTKKEKRETKKKKELDKVVECT